MEDENLPESEDKVSQKDVKLDPEVYNRLKGLKGVFDEYLGRKLSMSEIIRILVWNLNSDYVEKLRADLMERSRLRHIASGESGYPDFLPNSKPTPSIEEVSRAKMIIGLYEDAKKAENKDTL